MVIIIQFIVYKINKYYNSKIINDWWNHRGGSKYSKCFNVDLINSYSSNKLLYSINTLFELLIEDISFIELNQAYDVCYNLTNLIYNDTQYQAYAFSEIENNIYSTIEIDVRNLLYIFNFNPPNFI